MSILSYPLPIIHKQMHYITKCNNFNSGYLAYYEHCLNHFSQAHEYRYSEVPYSLRINLTDFSCQKHFKVPYTYIQSEKVQLGEQIHHLKATHIKIGTRCIRDPRCYYFSLVYLWHCKSGGTRRIHRS